MLLIFCAAPLIRMDLPEKTLVSCKPLGEDNSIQVQQDRLIWTPRMWPPNNN